MKLQAALQNLKETQGQIAEGKGRLRISNKSSNRWAKKPKAKKCEAIVGLLKEGDEIAAEFKGSPAINAALIAAGQKVEHYEIATYGCLPEWAELLGHQEGAGPLKEIRGPGL